MRLMRAIKKYMGQRRICKNQISSIKLVTAEPGGYQLFLYIESVCCKHLSPTYTVLRQLYFAYFEKYMQFTHSLQKKLLL